jgi:ring-1,2-phenylacetyl-CoA epoxidase subunit PaaC
MHSPVSPDPQLRYLLRLADTCLIHAQRLAEWCGHAPVLEEDIALTNLSLDLIGQARALYSHAATVEGGSPAWRDEDALAFLREERDYRNPTLVELPMRRGISGPAEDFAGTVLRNLLVATLLKQVWQALSAPGGTADAELAAIAAKALKEARYHQQHCGRLGGAPGRRHRGIGPPHARRAGAQWPYVAELFAADAVDAARRRQRPGPGAGRPACGLARRGESAVLHRSHADARPSRHALPISTGTPGRAQRAHGLHAGRDAVAAAPAYPGGVW